MEGGGGEGSMVRENDHNLSPYLWLCTQHNMKEHIPLDGLWSST